MLWSQRGFALLGILAGIIMVQACGRPMSPEQSCNFVQNSQLQRVSWKGNLPVVFHVDSSFPADYMPALNNAIATWNNIGQKSLGEDLFRVKLDQAGSAIPSKDGYSKLYFMNEWDGTMPNEQARTTIFWSGSRIYEADIRINGQNFQYFLDHERPDYSKVHLESLLVHELGHALGLAHNHASESVMAAELANGYLRHTPSSSDVGDLSCEYKM